MALWAPMAGGSKAGKALWRRRLLAAGVVAGLHLAFLTVIVSDWARHRRPYRTDTIVLTIERPPQVKEAPQPPKDASRPAPPPPLAPQVAASPSSGVLTARPSPVPPTAEVAPLVAGAAVGPPATRPGGTLNLGCMTPNLPKRLREECDRERYVAALAKPADPRLKGIGPQKPVDRAAPKPPEPGWHFGFPLGLTYVYGPNDKHFLPGFGETKTTVFEPERVDFLPPPMK
jgi:hypothetical protein